jgi:hypothetical protein
VTPIGRTHLPVLRWTRGNDDIELSEHQVEVFPCLTGSRRRGSGNR